MSPDGGIDCVLTRRRHPSRDGFGNVLSPAGRVLVSRCAAALHGAGEPVRDPHRRWGWPALDLHASVAHVGATGVVALSRGARVGVDLQDERDRPAAMAWLGRLLGRGGPAVVRDFAECEALIKATRLTKETFAGVRLPAWRPGWRAVGVPGDRPHVVSTHLTADGWHLALVAPAPRPVRWWFLTTGGALRPLSTPAAPLLEEVPR